MLNTTVPEWSVHSITQTGSSETCIQKQEKKERQKSPGSLFWGRQRQTSQLYSCFISWHKGSHLSSLFEVLTWESLCRRIAEYRSEFSSQTTIALLPSQLHMYWEMWVFSSCGSALILHFTSQECRNYIFCSFSISYLTSSSNTLLPEL